MKVHIPPPVRKDHLLNSRTGRVNNPRLNDPEAVTPLDNLA
jgi:hypothetical protein